MASLRMDELPNLVSYVIRPALAEAKLITQKRASDSVYVATLTEELHNIESTIASLENDLHLSPPTDTALQCGAPEESMSFSWIRTKSRELEARLRHIEELSPARTQPRFPKHRTA